MRAFDWKTPFYHKLYSGISECGVLLLQEMSVMEIRLGVFKAGLDHHLSRKDHNISLGVGHIANTVPSLHSFTPLSKCSFTYVDHPSCCIEQTTCHWLEISCETLGELLNLTVSPLFPLLNGRKDVAYIVGLL